MEKTNPNDAAFAAKGYDQAEKNCYGPDGLTKREYFAAMALQGILSNKHYSNEQMMEKAGLAVDYAELLIDELNKTND